MTNGTNGKYNTDMKLEGVKKFLRIEPSSKTSTWEEIDEAQKKQRVATASFLRGEITLDAYKQINKELYPILRIDFRAMGRHFRG